MHWTYRNVDAAGDLQQGDILERREELLALFRQVHPHFCDEKYVAFLVLTQTCDLVRRKGQGCRSRYVSVAAVRLLRGVLPGLLDTVCERAAPGVYLQESRSKATQLLERLFSQNEQALGLFYLHPDADAGIGEPAVGILQVSVAFRREHYACLQNARRGGLTEEFQAKLGWLVGNLFSRVATTDWTESEARRQGLRALLKEHLDGPPAAAGGPIWISRTQKEALDEARIDLERTAPSELAGLLRRHEPKSTRDQVLEIVRQAMRQATQLSVTEIDGIATSLQNNPQLAKLLKGRFT